MMPEMLLAGIKAFAYGCVVSQGFWPHGGMHTHACCMSAVSCFCAGLLTSLSGMCCTTHICETAVLCLLCVLCHSYPVIVGSVLGLFSCKELNTAAQVPGEVNAAQGTFWNRVSGDDCGGECCSAVLCQAINKGGAFAGSRRCCLHSFKTLHTVTASGLACFLRTEVCGLLAACWHVYFPTTCEG